MKTCSEKNATFLTISETLFCQIGSTNWKKLTFVEASKFVRATRGQTVIWQCNWLKFIGKKIAMIK